jgi:hypothetical protein
LPCPVFRDKDILVAHRQLHYHQLIAFIDGNAMKPPARGLA